jgi:hypothetical protein
MIFRRLLPLISIGLAACSPITDQNILDSLYETSLEKWQQANLASYEFVLARTCICEVTTESVVIVVRNRAVESRTYLETGDPLPPDLIPRFPDIPGLFDLIRRTRAGDPYRIGIEFDPTYGYPTLIDIDQRLGHLEDNLAYSVTGFTVGP